MEESVEGNGNGAEKSVETDDRIETWLSETKRRKKRKKKRRKKRKKRTKRREHDAQDGHGYKDYCNPHRSWA